MIRRTTYQPATPDTPTIDDWRMYAACAAEGIDPEDMFPEGKGRDASVRYAKGFCFLCPVLQECLEDAMALEGRAGRDHRFGIRAGLTGAERAALYRRNPRRWGVQGTWS